MRYFKPNKLHCFSPPVMIATFVIEIVFAITTLARYKFDAVTKLIVSILLCLAIFQFAEFNVCEGSLMMTSYDWARVGFIAITMLPVLGVHLGMVIAQRLHRSLIFVAYIMAIVFGLYFAMSPNGITGSVCLGNYAIFSYAPFVGNLYSLYYFGWLIVGTVFTWKASQATSNHHRAVALRWLMIGYLAFIVPTIIVAILDPTTLEGIPSIMCGFAVLLALALVIKVMPEYRRATVIKKTVVKKHG